MKQSFTRYVTPEDHFRHYVKLTLILPFLGFINRAAANTVPKEVRPFCAEDTDFSKDFDKLIKEEKCPPYVLKSTPVSTLLKN